MIDARRRAAHALDRLVPAKNPGIGGVDDPTTDPPQRAREFLKLKLDAMFHVGAQIRAEMPAHRLGYDAMVAMHAMVDAFLFEASSVRDALAQVANAVFRLGISIDEPRLGESVNAGLLQHMEGRHTGLDIWFKSAGHPSWLERLLRLRNTTSHRHVLFIPLRAQWPGPGCAWEHDFLIGTSRADSTTLEVFLVQTETGVAELTAETLLRLIDLAPNA